MLKSIFRRTIPAQDFRIQPETGELETASGLTQQGRVRDDWGNWFGCDNTNLIFHFPFPDRYARRNPAVPAPAPAVYVPDYENSNQLYPASLTLARYNDPGHANRVTSACGLGIYRDELLGPEFKGNAFACEPVHNLVHRLVLSENGITFTGRRPADEERSEFLASSDNWFRPVQALTGPDGALWIVDMYRFLIEHPRWITPERLEKVLEAARRLARSEAAPEAERAAALALLERGPGREAGDLELLASLLQPATPEPIRQAALAALRRGRDPKLADLLLENWQQRSPSLRADLLNLLLGRAEFVGALVAAVEAGELQPKEFSAEGRERLLKHADPEVRKRAAEIFSAPAESNREQVVGRYRAALSLAGAAARGMEIFSKHCTPCHFLAGQGHEVGPDLSAFREKEADYWLKSIFDPNAAADPRFLSYLVLTRDGRALTGVIKEETSTAFTVAQNGGTQESLLRRTIKEIRANGASLMPEGLEENLSLQDFADLLAFLRSSRPLKGFPGNRPELLKPEEDGSILLPAASAEIYGGEIAFENPFKNIGMWHGQSDHAVWTVEVEKDGDYDVHLDWACHDAVAGNAYALEAGESGGTGLRGRVSGTGGWDRYRQEKIGALPLKAGRTRLAFRPGAPLQGALIDLRALFLVPAGKRPAWERAHGAPPSDPEKLAAYLLDGSKPEGEREAVIERHLDRAAKLISILAGDLQPGAPAEYERIPWIWRAALAAGRENDAVRIRPILEVALPKLGQPLRDWQAVVLGGGLVNSLSQKGLWPGERLEEIRRGRQDLEERWRRALELASPLADDPKFRLS